MKGVNKVIIIGHVGKEPEYYPLSDEKGMTFISVATNESWTDKEGNKKENTEWHRIKIFNKLADFAKNYVKKGAKVYVSGKLKTNKWQDKDGIEKYATDIIANEIQLLDRKEKEENKKDDKVFDNEVPYNFEEDFNF